MNASVYDVRNNGFNDFSRVDLFPIVASVQLSLEIGTRDDCGTSESGGSEDNSSGGGETHVDLLFNLLFKDGIEGVGAKSNLLHREEIIGRRGGRRETQDQACEVSEGSED